MLCRFERGQGRAIFQTIRRTFADNHPLEGQHADGDVVDGPQHGANEFHGEGVQAVDSQDNVDAIEALAAKRGRLETGATNPEASNVCGSEADRFTAGRF